MFGVPPLTPLGGFAYAQAGGDVMSRIGVSPALSAASTVASSAPHE